jgi:hypothetical protein
MGASNQDKSEIWTEILYLFFLIQKHRDECEKFDLFQV